MDIVRSLLLKAGGIRQEVSVIKEEEGHLGETDGTSCESSLETGRKGSKYKKNRSYRPGNMRKLEKTRGIRSTKCNRERKKG